MLLPTPSGWTTLEDLRAGDLLLNPSGRPVAVSSVSDPYRAGGYRVTLASREHFDVPAGQRWQTQARSGRRGGRLTTAFIARRVTEGADERPIYAVPITEPLQLPEAELPIDPYVLGAWLGDGDTEAGAMTSGDVDRDFIRGQFHAAGFATVMRAGSGGVRWGVYGLHQLLRQEGLLGNKHVPADYLRASHRQRLALFQGLMDTDGTVNEEGQACFSSTLLALADGALEVGRTLGLKARLYESRAVLNGVDHGTHWRVSFWAPPQLPVFRLVRKADRQRPLRSRRSRFEYIHRVEPIGSVTTRDIVVADADGHFLAGRDLVPLCDARAVAHEDPAAVRAWALTQGFHMGVTGPIREEIMRAYREASRTAELAPARVAGDGGSRSTVDNKGAMPLAGGVQVTMSDRVMVQMENNVVAASEDGVVPVEEDDIPIAAGGRLLLW